MPLMMVCTREPLSSSSHVDVATPMGTLTDGQARLAWNEIVEIMPPRVNFLADFRNLRAIDADGVEAVRKGFDTITEQGGNFKISNARSDIVKILAREIPSVELYANKEAALKSDWSQRAAPQLRVNASTESRNG